MKRVRHVSPWTIGASGTQKHAWHVFRTIDWTEEGIQRHQQEQLEGRQGRLRRFMTSEAARKAADKANRSETVTADDIIRGASRRLAESRGKR